MRQSELPELAESVSSTSMGSSIFSAHNVTMLKISIPRFAGAPLGYSSCTIWVHTSSRCVANRLVYILEQQQRTSSVWPNHPTICASTSTLPDTAANHTGISNTAANTPNVNMSTSKTVARHAWNVDTASDTLRTQSARDPVMVRRYTAHHTPSVVYKLNGMIHSMNDTTSGIVNSAKNSHMVTILGVNLERTTSNGVMVMICAMQFHIPHQTTWTPCNIRSTPHDCSLKTDQ